MGGSCAACIGQFVVDLGLFLLSSFAKELYCPQDYAPDAVFLCLFTYSTMKK